VTVECRERILEANAEFADHHSRVLQLLLILFLRQVFVLQSSAEIANVPPAATVLHDLDVARVRQCLFVQCVRDDFAQRMVHAPVFEHLLDIQVELLHRQNPTTRLQARLF
jgi:hypothetical protein